MISEYIDKKIINCQNRCDMKNILKEISSIPPALISGFAEAFYCAASISYNTHYGNLAEDTLAYFRRVGYITSPEREQLEDIIKFSVTRGDINELC